jgi:hypothetical protein
MCDDYETMTMPFIILSECYEKDQAISLQSPYQNQPKINKKITTIGGLAAIHKTNTKNGRTHRCTHANEINTPTFAWELKNPISNSYLESCQCSISSQNPSLGVQYTSIVISIGQSRVPLL